MFVFMQFVMTIILVLALVGTPANTTNPDPSTNPSAPSATLAPEVPETIPEEDMPLTDLPEEAPAETTPALPEGASVDTDGIHVVDKQGNPIGALFINEDGSEVFMPY